MPSFVWPVCEAGYQWLAPAGGAEGESLLVATKPWPTREYEPLRSEAALFLQFAELATEPAALLRFPNRFGTLCRATDSAGAQPEQGRTSQKRSKARFTDSSPANKVEQSDRTPPESLGFWVSQIEAMRSAVTLWEMIREGKTDPAELARVADTIESHCEGRVTSRFEFDRVQRACAWVRTPRDLVGALWLQFAEAVAGDKKYRRCSAPGCGKWYELPRLKGPDRNQCSTACKTRAFRYRKALELFGKGRTDEEVSKEVGTALKTVKGWRPTDSQGDGGDSTEGGLRYTRPGLDL